MVATIKAVYERYGFEPVETPLVEYTEALGKFLPDQDRPNEGVFSFRDQEARSAGGATGNERTGMMNRLAVPPLRPDRAARPLRRRELRAAAEALPQLPLGLGFPEREARPRPLPPVHAVRRRHGRRRLARRRRRDVHDGGRHAGGARHPARAVRHQGQFAKVLDGVMEASASAAKRTPAVQAHVLRAIDNSTGSVGGRRALLGAGRKDEIPVTSRRRGSIGRADRRTRPVLHHRRRSRLRRGREGAR